MALPNSAVEIIRLDLPSFARVADLTVPFFLLASLSEPESESKLDAESALASEPDEVRLAGMAGGVAGLELICRAFLELPEGSIRLALMFLALTVPFFLALLSKSESKLASESALEGESALEIESSDEVAPAGTVGVGAAGVARRPFHESVRLVLELPTFFVVVLLLLISESEFESGPGSSSDSESELSAARLAACSC
ncbi:hypothetical protein PG994_000027 [Apiospora phragmitis]|uniref:Uncharacterized protein n=1 Tax=Apiospora phragmitis TaxID=2905665 RepID=A0ABR1X540_9PEZI